MEMSERVQRGMDRTENGDSAGLSLPGEDPAVNRRVPGPGEKIYDLQDIVRDGNGKGNQEVIVIDGRVYERALKPDDKVYDLDDIVEKGFQDTVSPVGGGAWNEEAARIVAQTAEKIAREMVPAIAERVIQEEIEKLKRDHGLVTGK